MSLTLGDLAQDIRYAWRRLRQAPAFTAVAVLTLTLGVGVNAALFSVVNGVIFRSLNVPQPERLVTLAHTRNGEANSNVGQTERRLERFAARGPKLIHGVFGVSNLQVSFEHDNGASIAMAEAVTDDYFSTLGVRPLVGRLLVRGDDRAGAAAGPLVLSARVWRRFFNSSPAVIGRVVGVNGLRLSVVGVAPDGFRGLTIPNLLGADLWMPVNSVRSLLGNTGQHRDGLLIRSFARLSLGATRRSADAEARTLSRHIDADDAELGIGILPASTALLPSQLANLQIALGLAVIAVSGLVLFIACANLSGLMLARISSRTSEIALRISLGAERQHLLRMQLAEAGLISSLAAAAGLAAAWSLTLLVPRLPIPEISGLVMAIDATPDLRVVAFATVAATVAMLLIASAPTARAVAIDPLTALTSGAVSGGTTPRPEKSTRRLVAFQVAASLALLLIATLFVRGAGAATAYEASVEINRVTAGRFDLRMQNMSDAAGRRLLGVLASAPTPPGVDRIALASGAPIAGDGRMELTMAPGSIRRLAAHTIVMSPSFFSLMKIDLLAGRTLTDADDVSVERVAIVSEDMAAAMWPGRNPIGQSLRFLSMRDSPTVTVVGVARTVDRAASGEDRRYVYLPLAQNYSPRMMILASAMPGASGAPANAMVEWMRLNAPGMAMFDVQPVSALVGVKATGARFAAAVIGCIGLIGMAITVVGLYGTVAFLVSERTREFGIMRALGAETRDIERLVLRGALRMLALGIAPGALVTFVCAGFLRSYLLGLPPHDPVTFVLVPIAMCVVGSVAAWIPAHRAARANPIDAIRSR